MHPLAVQDHGAVSNAVLRARAEKKVGEVIEVVRAAPRRPAELTVVSILAVLRMEILDVGVDGLVLVSDLEAVPRQDFGIIHPRVKDQRILMLRVAVLASERSVTADRLRIESSGDRGIFGNARDAIARQHARRAEIDRRFAGLRARDA